MITINKYTISLISIILVFLFSCKTQEKIIEIPSISHDTILLYRDITDSLIIRDSVYIASVTDTIKEYRYRYIDRLKIIHDSIYIGRTDTINNIIEVEIEKELTSKEKIAMWIGSRLWWLILLCLLFIVWRIIRR